MLTFRCVLLMALGVLGRDATAQLRPVAEQPASPVLRIETSSYPDTTVTLPRIRLGPVLGQYMLGTGASVAGGFGAGLVGYGLDFIVLGDTCGRNDTWICVPALSVVGGLAGYVTGAAWGVWAAGRNDRDQTAPFWAVQAGSAVGFGALVLILPEASSPSGGEIALLLSLTTFGAMTAFYLTRRVPRAPQGDYAAFLTLGGGTWRVGVPAVALVPDVVLQVPSVAYQVPLARVTW